ncbi:hypothetical protein K402DRAFT_324696 [Aulographum hederae CBS 113979]|uniref:Uncharacterized protein n=1 Tax=Aulographum hederae CBS 113979 TaxID=1176131 RepID=A0A6G1HBV3_9PEZI|nr:hypothetical protein K402DRAFT_324696 [Aulographum hederae CBS 113979]
MLGRTGLALLGLAAIVAAREMPKDMQRAADIFDNAERHETIMAQKHALWKRQREAGLFNSALYPPVNDVVKCVDGKAIAVPGDPMYTFNCDAMDLYQFLPHGDLGSTSAGGSSSWGWVSPEGREFVAIGQEDGAAFIEITKEGKMLYLGRLPPFSENAIWREIRPFGDYMVIGSEAEGHNIQIFDMKDLLTIDPTKPRIWDKKAHAIFDGLPMGRTHTVGTNPETNFAYSFGAVPRFDICRSGIIFINMTDPLKPEKAGCAAMDGYVHDAQVLTYKGPHTKYVGREIAYGYNEDSLTIYDITDKRRPTIVSITSYEGAAYTHQGAVLDPNNQTYILMDDEYDEFDGTGLAKPGNPVTYIWDISDLEKPKQTGTFINKKSYSIDHNQYIKDGFSYQSNYGSGFRVLDVSSIPSDPTGAGVKEVAFFDVYPEDDALPNGGLLDFVGTWSSYAFLPSRFIFVNTIERGAFVLRMQKDGPPQGNKTMKIF